VESNKQIFYESFLCFLLFSPNLNSLKHKNHKRQFIPVKDRFFEKDTNYLIFTGFNKKAKHHIFHFSSKYVIFTPACIR